MRITSKGQVTIPVGIRERAGLLPHTEVEFALENGQVVIRPAGEGDHTLTPGQRMIARLRGAGDIPMTTDEIMDLTRGPYNDLDPAEPSLAVHENARPFVKK